MGISLRVSAPVFVAGAAFGLALGAGAASAAALWCDANTIDIDQYGLVGIRPGQQTMVYCATAAGDPRGIAVAVAVGPSSGMQFPTGSATVTKVSCPS